MPAYHDLYSAHAADYRTYRPTYPPALFEWLAAAAPARGLAWDCGTGSGQAAVALAGHFGRVVATDASPEQLAHAPPHPRVEYAVAPAERGPLGGGTADLVAVAQALHWFDFDRFYAEVRRVGRPGALLAAWTYERPQVTPAVDAVLARYGREYVDAHWPPERAYVDAGYRTLPFPFPEVACPPFAMAADWTLGRYLGYLDTWSATKRFIAATGRQPLDALAGEFAAAWGDPTAVRAVTWPLTVRAGRVNA